MSNLLQVIRARPEAMTRKGVTPIILEFGVDEATAPYLVSASSGTMWIETPHPGDKPIIKAAVQKNITPGEMFWMASKAIYERSLTSEWGSAQPYTQEGLEAAIEHVSSYGMGTVEILIPPGKKEDRPKWLLDRDVGEFLRVSSWVPENCVIIVPTDRNFVGMIVHLSPTATAMAVHNPSRGFAMCWNPPGE